MNLVLLSLQRGASWIRYDCSTI